MRYNNKRHIERENIVLEDAQKKAGQRRAAALIKQRSVMKRIMF
jgi:hypothetical protein